MRKVEFHHYGENDFEVIWEAYKSKSFDLPEMGKLQFVAWLANARKRYQEFLIVEHRSKPIAFVGAYFDGWKYEPHVEFFASATKREVIESSVEFFTRLKRLDTVGVVVVKALEGSKNLFDHVCKHGCLEYVGLMQKGDYRGNEYIYSTAGNALTATHTTTPTIGRL